MSDVVKILGQLDAAATTTETLYTAPALSFVTTSTLTVCNRGTTQKAFRVSVHQKNSTADDKQFIFYDTPLAGNSTLTATIGMTLAEGDIVKTYADSTGLSFNLFGVETS